MSEMSELQTETETEEERARRILKRVARVAEPYVDGTLITDYGIGNREYGNELEVWILGNWNPKRFPRDGDPELTREENLGPRLAEALEYLGAEIHWLDEWMQCHECAQIFRTSPNSYFWMMSGVITEHGDVWCSVCALEDLEELLEPYLNDPNRAVFSWITSEHLTGLGFSLVSDRNETGWHAGMDADPRQVFDRERENYSELLFRISEVSQFYSTWEVWSRDPESEEETG